MKKIALILMIGSALALAGCKSKTVTVGPTKTIVVVPPETLYNCRRVNLPSNWEVITNEEIAKLIATLAQTNEKCAMSIDKIRKYLLEAKKLHESKK